MGRNSIKKATNLSIDSAVLSTAKGLNINLPEAEEIGSIHAMFKPKVQQWEIEKQSAMQTLNDFVEEHGLPLHLDRLF